MMVVDESLIETGVSILYHIFMFKCVAYSPPPPLLPLLHAILTSSQP
jgi:hypothetical protein